MYSDSEYSPIEFPVSHLLQNLEQSVAFRATTLFTIGWRPVHNFLLWQEKKSHERECLLVECIPSAYHIDHANIYNRQKKIDLFTSDFDLDLDMNLTMQQCQRNASRYKCKGNENVTNKTVLLRDRKRRIARAPHLVMSEMLLPKYFVSQIYVADLKKRLKKVLKKVKHLEKKLWDPPPPSTTLLETIQEIF